MGSSATGRGGTHFILVILDSISKYTKLYIHKKVFTKVIVNRLELNYIPKLGKPRYILNNIIIIINESVNKVRKIVDNRGQWNQPRDWRLVNKKKIIQLYSIQKSMTITGNGVF